MLDARVAERAARAPLDCPRCMTPFLSGAITCTKECGLRNRNCTTVPSI